MLADHLRRSEGEGKTSNQETTGGAQLAAQTSSVAWAKLNEWGVRKSVLGKVTKMRDPNRLSRPSPARPFKL